MSSAVIYSVPLPPLGTSENNQGRLHSEAEFPLGETELLKDMDPYSGRALLCFAPTSLHIVHWRDDNRRSTVNIQMDDHDEGVSIVSLARGSYPYAHLIPQWNGITSLRFCGPYILCFRIRTVEAYPVPMDTPTVNSLPMLRHRFGPVCFRAVSLSRVRVSRCPSGEVYTIFMLTNDVYQGMFHYRIRITTSPVPSMSVKVLAKGGIRISQPPPLIPGTSIRYALDDVVRRMYISSWSLGSAGLRGVWVDRQRGSIDRRVVAFTTHPNRLCAKEAPSVPGEDLVPGGDAPNEVQAMDGKVVHVISSYDLRGTCVVRMCFAGLGYVYCFV